MEPPGGELAGISLADEQHQLDAVDPGDGAAVLAPRPARATVMPRAANQAIVSSCSRPFDGTPSLSMPRPRSAPASASGRIMPPTAGMARPWPSARVSAS